MDYDIIIIGAGHAGIEAAVAASRMGSQVLLITQKKEAIGLLSCNPAIGGVGKAQLVKEIDALGGVMARAADSCGIQFRMLNASKGIAAQSLRAQIDMDLYNDYMKALVAKTDNLSLLEAEVKKLIIKKQKIEGVITDKNENINCDCLIITPGTFLGGLIHIGLEHFPGGRINEAASVGLGDDLRNWGFNILRFKTGTCARLDKNTIDYSALKIQEGDQPATPFSFSTPKIKQQQSPCYITYTNEKTHQIIRDNLSRSPLYQGIIKATGVRYCPSIEDKIVKFSERPRHQVFLEPEGLTSPRVYPNGLSTSLPRDAQLALIHSIAGLEKAEVLRFGYGIEHDVVEPTQLFPTLEAKLIKGLYFAGQINGTTGYEEAAAQGLIAGINAALRIKGKEAFVLDRSQGYIGVLIDDLTTRGTNEPYRMFTSRVEYRLVLRQDNADLRLSKFGRELGLLSKKDLQRVQQKSLDIQNGIVYLRKTRVSPSKEINQILSQAESAALRKMSTLEEILKRPRVRLVSLSKLPGLAKAVPEYILQAVENEIKYAGFIQRQISETEKFKNLERIKLPADLDFALVPSLSREIKEKLTKTKPINLGQAARISGVTPVAISILMVYLRKYCSNGQK